MHISHYQTTAHYRLKKALTKDPTFLFNRSSRAADENRVLADKLDVAPRNYSVVIPSQKSEKLQPAVDHDRNKLCGFSVYLNIVNKSQSHTVGLVYYFFMAKLRYSAAHMYHLGYKYICSIVPNYDKRLAEAHSDKMTRLLEKNFGSPIAIGVRM